MERQAKEILLERQRISCQTILAMLPFTGLKGEALEVEQDYWTTHLTIAEEKLYNVRHGDGSCPLSIVG